MKPEPVTRASASGAAIGVLVLTFFGAIWAFAALGNRPATPAWAFGLCAIPFAVLTVLGVRRLIAAGRLPAPENEAQAASEDRREGRWFGVVFAAEGILIVIASNVLAHAGKPLLIPVAIAAIVGVHFFPLARLFRRPFYWVTGTLLVLCAGGSLLIADERGRLFALGLAAAAVLWSSAAFVLARSAAGATARGAPRSR